jgi:hypothetical protein
VDNWILTPTAACASADVQRRANDGGNPCRLPRAGTCVFLRLVDIPAQAAGPDQCAFLVRSCKLASHWQAADVARFWTQCVESAAGRAVALLNMSGKSHQQELPSGALCAYSDTRCA